MARVQSLAWELSHAAGAAKRRREKNEVKRYVNQKENSSDPNSKQVKTTSKFAEEKNTPPATTRNRQPLGNTLVAGRGHGHQLHQKTLSCSAWGQHVPTSQGTVPGARFLDGNTAQRPCNPVTSPLRSQPKAAARNAHGLLLTEGPRGFVKTAKPKPCR